MAQGGAEQPPHVLVRPEAALQLRDGVDILCVGDPQRLSDHAVGEPRRLQERWNRLEDDQLSAEEQRASALVVERPGEDVDADAQDSVLPASSCFGVSFSGSTNGLGTMVAATVSSGFSISSSVPSSECSVGTIAKPMFFSRRGE
jgi:hypothetical protein